MTTKPISDEALAEIEEYADRPHSTDGDEQATVSISELRGLLSRIHQAEQDAERYRWLRHGDNDEEVLVSYGKCFAGEEITMYMLRGDELDTAIDTAMQATRHD